MPKAVVPNEVKAKRGTLRADRLPAVSLTNSLTGAAELPPPEGLGVVALEAWHRILAHAGGWIAASDREALTMLVQAMEFHAQLGKQIAEQGAVLQTDKGYAYANPAVGMRATQEGEIRKWMNHLGLTPADRAKLGLAMVESVSKVEQFRRRLQGKDGHPAG